MLRPRLEFDFMRFTKISTWVRRFEVKFSISTSSVAFYEQRICIRVMSLSKRFDIYNKICIRIVIRWLRCNHWTWCRWIGWHIIRFVIRCDVTALLPVIAIQILGQFRVGRSIVEARRQWVRTRVTQRRCYWRHVTRCIWAACFPRWHTIRRCLQRELWFTEGRESMRVP